MNDWLIRYWMKNGYKLQGIYRGPETASDSVFEILFDKATDDTFVGIFGVNKDSNLLVRFGEIAAVDISVLLPNEEKKNGQSV